MGGLAANPPTWGWAASPPVGVAYLSSDWALAQSIMGLGWASTHYIESGPFILVGLSAQRFFSGQAGMEYLLTPLGRVGRGGSSGRGGVRNGGLWWLKITSEGDGSACCDGNSWWLKLVAGVAEPRGRERERESSGFRERRQSNDRERREEEKGKIVERGDEMRVNWQEKWKGKSGSPRKGHEVNNLTDSSLDFLREFEWENKGIRIGAGSAEQQVCHIRDAFRRNLTSAGSFEKKGKRGGRSQDDEEGTKVWCNSSNKGPQAEHPQQESLEMSRNARIPDKGININNCHTFNVCQDPG
uniref:Uncharacterized protein n=1 Tax=Salix viminalis TaxID=40686 RepID=A0A6N2L1S7_SALVM